MGRSQSKVDQEHQLFFIVHSREAGVPTMAQREMQQCEFLFVFNSREVGIQTTLLKEETKLDPCMRDFSLDSCEAKAARQKLITELREFGC